MAGKEENAADRVDNIAKHSQQRRSSKGAKRHSDFGLFRQPSSSSCSNCDASLAQGPLVKSMTDKESPLCVIIPGLDDTKSEGEARQKLSQSTCSDSQDNKHLLTPEKPNCSSDKLKSPDSANVNNESPMRRSVRDRKMTARFRKETIPSKSAKKARRLKILRNLGLVAPAGSPYALPGMTFD